MQPAKSNPRARHAWRLGPHDLVDHFRVMRPIGLGGMAEVYLARDLKLGRRVALKMIHPSALGSEQAIQRFLFEARATARFNHPHIVTIYAVGEHKGVPYLALEYIPGQTLRERIKEERLGRVESLRITLAVAEALAEAHQNKVLHRDLKPENILIPLDGRLRVLDFGLAKVLPELDAEDPESELSDSRTTKFAKKRVLLGTPAYMAPEQWLAGATTTATDIWAVGIILYELLHGQRPYQNAASTTILEARVIDPEPVGDVDKYHQLAPELARLIEGCLAKDPSQRPTALQVVHVLKTQIDAVQLRWQEGKNPFLGLLPFDEGHAGFFFGRDGEIANFLERMRFEPVLPVVGQSGSGKSSLIQAGVIPRLREQGSWIVLTLRPGNDPFGVLAARLLHQESRLDRMGQLPQQTFSRSEDTDGWTERITLADETCDTEKTRSSASTGELSPGPSIRPNVCQGSAQEQLHLARQLQDNPLNLSLLLRELAERERSKVLLFVDQLEEIYTLTSEEETRNRFMHALCTAADDAQEPVRVVFTLRDDFLGRPMADSMVREALGRVTVVLSPGLEALHEILQRPLDALGYTFEDPQMVDEMVAQVRDEPACLPLLQFAARVLWEQRDRARHVITRGAYDAIGGVAGALAQHADGVLEGMSPAQMLLARQIFLRLVTPERTRRVLSRARVEEGLGELAPEVLRRLTRARLITEQKGQENAAEEGELELAHESLIRTWGRLKRWIDEGHEDLAFLHESSQAAELWIKRGERVDEVWQGDALHEALRAKERCTSEVPESVVKFLNTGLRREKLSLKRRRWFMAAGFVLLSLVAVVLATQNQEARQQRNRAEAQRVQAEQRHVEAQRQRAASQREGALAALLRGEILEARAKLRGSFEGMDSSMARALWWRLKMNPLRWIKKLDAMVYSVAVAPDNQTVAAACQDRAIYLLDVNTRAIRILRGHGDQVIEVAFSLDGAHLASSTWSGEVGLWDLQSGALKLLKGHTSRVQALRFSPDSKLLATASEDATVRLWDVPTGQLHRVLRGHHDKVWGVDFSPDGKLLASASMDRTIRLWRVKTAALVYSMRGPAEVNDVRFNPDGRVLVSSGNEPVLRTWDVSSGEPLRVLRGLQRWATKLSFSADGRFLATAGPEQTIPIWDMRSGELARRIEGHQDSVRSVSFSSDGKFLVSGSKDKSIRIWNLTAMEPRRVVGGHTKAVYGLSFNPKGDLLASGSADTTVHLWETASGQKRAVLRGHNGRVYGVSFSPDGELLASGSWDQSVRLWRVSQRTATKVLWGHSAPVFYVRFSPDGKLLASGSVDNTIRLWSPQSGSLIKVLRGHTARVEGLEFSPDSLFLASASSDRTVRIWDLRRGVTLRVLRGHTSRVFGVSFSPDGRHIASAAGDQTVRLWQVPSGQGRLLRQFAGRAYLLSFSPAGNRLGVPLSTGEAHLLDLEGQTMTILNGHQGEVNSIAFNREGKVAATSGDDQTVRLWNVATGIPLWHAPLLSQDSLEIFAQQGWRSLSSTVATRSPRNPQWRRAVEQQANLAIEAGGMACLHRYNGELSLWDLQTDRRLFHRDAPEVVNLEALASGGCLTRTRSGQVARYTRSGEKVLVTEETTAMSVHGDEILVAAKRWVQVYRMDGTPKAQYPADINLSVLARVGSWIALGYADGNIELLSLTDGKRLAGFTFKDVPSSAVIRLLPGPMDTLVAGYANGLVGIWSLKTGVRLHYRQLHGPVSHLLLKDRHLYVASELGDHLVLDLGGFYQSYCQVLRQVWQAVPVIWADGRARQSAPPREHPCYQANALKK